MQNRFKIIVDTDEKKPWVFQEDNMCLGEIHKALHVGDYSIEGLEDKFFIERKSTVAELAKNINESRWPRWLEKTKSVPHRFMICEFGYYDIDAFPSRLPKRVRDKIRVTPKYIHKCIAQMEIKYDLHIKLCNNRESAFKAAGCLLKRMNEFYK